MNPAEREAIFAGILCLRSELSVIDARTAEAIAHGATAAADIHHQAAVRTEGYIATLSDMLERAAAVTQ